MYPWWPCNHRGVSGHARGLSNVQSPEAWNGEHFFGYVVERRGGQIEFWFRAHRNAITLGFSQPEWAAVQELFRRDCESETAAPLPRAPL
jgi:hypothetical protein